jgi:hypothetical protein
MTTVDNGEPVALERAQPGTAQSPPGGQRGGGRPFADGVGVDQRRPSPNWVGGMSAAGLASSSSASSRRTVGTEPTRRRKFR